MLWDFHSANLKAPRILHDHDNFFIYKKYFWWKMTPKNMKNIIFDGSQMTYTYIIANEQYSTIYHFCQVPKWLPST